MLARDIGQDNIKQLLENEDRKAATKLLTYLTYKAEYEELTESIVWSRGIDPTGRRAGTGDPTSSKAIKLSQFHDTKAWIEVVEAVKATCGYKKRLLLDIRQNHLPESKGGRPGWVEHAQEEMSRKLGHVPERNIRAWWQELVILTVRIAKCKKIL